MSCFSCWCYLHMMQIVVIVEKRQIVVCSVFVSLFELEIGGEFVCEYEEWQSYGLDEFAESG